MSRTPRSGGRASSPINLISDDDEPAQNLLRGWGARTHAPSKRKDSKSGSDAGTTPLESFKRGDYGQSPSDSESSPPAQPLPRGPRSTAASRGGRLIWQAPRTVAEPVDSLRPDAAISQSPKPLEKPVRRAGVTASQSPKPTESLPASRPGVATGQPPKPTDGLAATRPAIPGRESSKLIDIPVSPGRQSPKAYSGPKMSFANTATASSKNVTIKLHQSAAADTAPVRETGEPKTASSRSASSTLQIANSTKPASPAVSVQTQPLVESHPPVQTQAQSHRIEVSSASPRNYDSSLYPVVPPRPPAPAVPARETSTRTSQYPPVPPLTTSSYPPVPGRALSAGIKRTFDGLVIAASPSTNSPTTPSHSPDALSSHYQPNKQPRLSYPAPPPQNNDPLVALAHHFGNEKTVWLVREFRRTEPQMGPGLRQGGWTDEEDNLVIHLKEELGLKWTDLHLFLPHRPKWLTVQSRYSSKLHKRDQVYYAAPPKALSEVEAEAVDFGAGSNSDDLDDAAVAARRSRRAVAAKYKPGVYQERLLSPLRDSPPVEETSKPQDQPSLSNQAAEETIAGRRLARGGPRITFSNDALPETRIRHMQDYRTAYQESVRWNTRARTAAAALARNSGRLPYLSFQERNTLDESLETNLWDSYANTEWSGSTIHVDMSEDEMLTLEPIICKTRALQAVANSFESTRERLEALMQGVSPKQLERIVAKAGPYLARRSSKSIKSFLVDAAWYHAELPASFDQLRVEPTRRRQPNVGIRSSAAARLLRQRELGHNVYISRDFGCFSESFGPKAHFKGTSGDVNVLAWSPDGSHFAAGSAALTDDASMQYNRPFNLLLGDVSKQTLYELPVHITPRHPTRSGPNAARNMQVSQEPWLFQSISAIQFTQDGQHLITAGFDCKARVWKFDGVSGSNGVNPATCVFEFNAGQKDPTPVEVMSTNSRGLFAYGHQHPLHPVRVNRYNTEPGLDDDSSFRVAKYGSKRPNKDAISPSCLKWGPELHGQDRFLLCGYNSKSKDYGGPGELQLWDVGVESTVPLLNSHCQSVFDATWSPSIYGRFAVGSAASSGSVNRGTKSVVRIYDSRGMANGGMTPDKVANIELECPAVDMNDVLFHPTDPNLVHAGCTDGIVYTWDLRKPDTLLHRFRHDTSLSPHDDDEPIEEVDTGVRFLAYAGSGLLYSGSSDGVVASWNPHLHCDDAFQRQVARLESSVMSGAFSPDYSELLLGDVNGNISLLSVGYEDRGFSMQEAEPFSLIEAVAEKERIRKTPQYAQAEVLSPGETGAAAARELLASGQVELRPLGNLPVCQAVQGPMYQAAHTFDERILNQREASLRRQTEARKHEGEPSCSCDQYIPRPDEDSLNVGMNDGNEDDWGALDSFYSLWNALPDSTWDD